jgi:uncharacterized protein
MDQRKSKWELPLFFLISYLLMGLGAVLYHRLGWRIFSINNLKIGPALIWFIMVFSPTLSALFLTGAFRGKTALIDFLKGYLKFNVKWAWYAAAFALLLVPLLLSAGFRLFDIGTGNGMDPTLTLTTFFGWMVFNFFSGPFAEEGGWRGYALPRLQGRYNSLVSSLILGFLWTLWHIPLAFVLGADQANLGLFGWMIYTILIFTITIILTWLYNNTRGSLVITILAHFCFNIGSNIVVNMLGLVNGMFYNIIGGIAGVIYLVLIFSAFGAKRFSKRNETEIPVISPA